MSLSSSTQAALEWEKNDSIRTLTIPAVKTYYPTITSWSEKTTTSTMSFSVVFWGNQSTPQLQNNECRPNSLTAAPWWHLCSSVCLSLTHRPMCWVTPIWVYTLSSRVAVDGNGIELSSALLFSCEAEWSQARWCNDVSVCLKVALHLMSFQLCWASVFKGAARPSVVQLARVDSSFWVTSCGISHWLVCSLRR